MSNGICDILKGASASSTVLKGLPLQSRSTPAANRLFETRETAPKLGEEDMVFFHSHSAKLLYVSKRIKPEMLTAVSFKNPMSARTR